MADVAFTGRGCAISQASASLLTDEIRGKTLDEVELLRPDDVLDLLGIEISPARLKCALLSLDTLSHAVSEGAVGGIADAGGSGTRDDPAGGPGGREAGSSASVPSSGPAAEDA